MDVVLVGLPGSGKTAVGRRLAHKHGAEFVDLDESIETADGRRIPEIFEDEGEASFRAKEHEAVAALGAPDADPEVRRVIATGGGAVIDPRNRWLLYRDRLPVWLDGRPEVLAQRLRRSPNVRPLIQGRDPIGAIRDLARSRARFYAAADRLNSASEVTALVEQISELAEARIAHPGGTVLLRADTISGQLVIGDGIASAEVAAAVRRAKASRAILVSEPGAWDAAGEALTAALAEDGLSVARVMLPQGEDAKRLSVIEAAARELAAMRAERGEPLVAVGGGALGDAAGFLAATWLRGVPLIHVPTTLVGQIDSSIGGKTGVDLPEGKNLVGAFHQPIAVVIDIAYLWTLPERHRRSALAEAVKMAVLGDQRLFALLEAEGDAIARGDDGPFANGAVAECVERAAWAKVEVVTADEKEQGAAGGRIALNLGHSLGHAFEAAGGFNALLHGEAVAAGLRAAAAIGEEMGVTPHERRLRIEALLDRLGLATEPLPYPIATVLAALSVDKKHAAGELRWVLPTADGYEVRTDVRPELVERMAASLLARGGVAAGRPS